VVSLVTLNLLNLRLMYFTIIRMLFSFRKHFQVGRSLLGKLLPSRVMFHTSIW